MADKSDEHKNVFVREFKRNKISNPTSFLKKPFIFPWFQLPEMLQERGLVSHYVIKAPKYSESAYDAF